MQFTYNDHKSAGGSEGHGNLELYLRNNLWRKIKESFSYDGCTIKTRTVSTLLLPYDTTHVINLKDADINSIKLIKIHIYDGGADQCDDIIGDVCNSARLYFETINQAPLVTVIFNDELYTKKGHEVEFIIDDVAYAARLAKALRRAIELCGGKASPF
jgi:hypothetical protein